MRKIRELLRLKHEKRLSNRAIATACSMSAGTVSTRLRLAREAGVSWPLPQDLDDGQLEALVFPMVDRSDIQPVVPDWALAHKELKRRGVTLLLLWQEYRTENPSGYGYSWFCDHYRSYCGRLSVVLRQEHRAGEKAFVDWAGHTFPVTEPDTGETWEAQIFIGVLGASSYTFACARKSQTLPDWISANVEMFEFFGGVTEMTVPDNLKTGVNAPCRYEPELNRTYQEWAEHTGTAVVPARVRKPQDKAKAESGVQVVEQWILARLRNQTFFSLDEFNLEIAKLLEVLNQEPFQKLPGSRKSLYEELDRPALQALPTARYEISKWKRAKLGADYHVPVDGVYYSAPYQLIGKTLDVRSTGAVVEIFHKNRRVASHRLKAEGRGNQSVLEHMPRKHREYIGWTMERLRGWATSNGSNTAEMVEGILLRNSHPHMGYRACLGLVSLAKNYSPERLEAACERALKLSSFSFKSVRSILKTGLDQVPLEVDGQPVTITHDNIRGASYYN